MSTASTDPPDAGLGWSRWTRNLLIPALIAIIIGAIGGGAFYYFYELKRPVVRHTNPSAARRVAADHMLVAIEDEAGESSAVALIGRSHDGPKVVTISPSIVVEVPGVGPRSVVLALRQTGAESAAVAVANVLRITVPSALAANGPTAAGSIDALGGLTVTVPLTTRSFIAGATHMTGDTFVRYMTGSFRGETEADRDALQQAGWHALLLATTKPEAAHAFSSWTTDQQPAAALALLRSCAEGAAPLTLPVTPIGLAGEHLVQIDEGGLPEIRRSLVDFTNGAETLDGRRVRLVIRATGAVGSIVGRILVNAGYVIQMSGKTATPATLTRIAVAPSVTDAEATGRDIADLLGMGLVKVSTDTSADTDIILTVGMDWAEANGFPQR